MVDATKLYDLPAFISNARGRGIKLIANLQVDHATAGDLHVGVPSRAAAARSELKLKQPSQHHLHIDKNGDEFTPRSSDYQVHRVYQRKSPCINFKRYEDLQGP